MHFQVDVAEQVVELHLRVEHFDALRISVVANAERSRNRVSIFTVKLKRMMKCSEA